MFNLLIGSEFLPLPPATFDKQATSSSFPFVRNQVNLVEQATFGRCAIGDAYCSMRPQVCHRCRKVKHWKKNSRMQESRMTQGGLEADPNVFPLKTIPSVGMGLP